MPFHCLGFLAQFEDELPNAEEALDKDYLSLDFRNLEEWESDEGENLGRVCSQYYRLFENFTMDVKKVVKVCAFNLLNLFKNTLIHFGFAKRFLLLGRLSKLSAQKLSWKDTYREMAASDEDWSDWDVTINDGLDGDKMKAKIDKLAVLLIKI